MSALTPTSKTTLHRRAQRGSYEIERIYAILDEGLVAHVGFVVDAQPYVLPMAYARIGDQLYLHGAAKNRMLEVVAAGGPMCVTVTLLDGLVLARSAFHHSVNYRCVVLFGVARELVDSEQKRTALNAIVDHMVEARSAVARAPSKVELAATRVIALEIAEASAKQREGPPIDDADDLLHPAWAGVIPLRLSAGEPMPAPDLDVGRALPDEVRRFLENRGS
jgi:nitroimidazol reductase NimA-like FMN-containing flavoprotein (pyridoxamine 5'-phosphate oxidase superfamily)